MGYQEMSDDYRNVTYRNRAEMCIKEQGLIYVNDGRKEIAALGSGVVSGSWMDIEAVMSAVSCGPNGHEAVTDDAALLSGVQSAWPTVAAARYPGLMQDIPVSLRDAIDRQVSVALANRLPMQA